MTEKDIEQISSEAIAAWTEYVPSKKALESAACGDPIALARVMQHAFHSGFIAAKCAQKLEGE